MIRSIHRTGLFLLLIVLCVGMAGSSQVLLDSGGSPAANPEIKTSQTGWLTDGESATVPGRDCMVLGTSSSTVTLGTGTFSVTAANSGQRYDVEKRTALGALIASGSTYTISDAHYAEYGSLFVESINGKRGQGTKGWMYQVNGGTPGVGSNVYTVGEGDIVVWYWSEGMTSTPESSSHVIRLTVASLTTVPTTAFTTTTRTITPTTVVTTATRTTVPKTAVTTSTRTMTPTTTAKTTVPTTALTTRPRTTEPVVSLTTVPSMTPPGDPIVTPATDTTAVTSSPVPEKTGTTPTTDPGSISSLPATFTITPTSSNNVPVTTPPDETVAPFSTGTTGPVSVVTTLVEGGGAESAMTSAPIPSRQVNTTNQTTGPTGGTGDGTVKRTTTQEDPGNGSTRNDTMVLTTRTPPALTENPTPARSAPSPGSVIAAVVLLVFFAFGRKQG